MNTPNSQPTTAPQQSGSRHLNVLPVEYLLDEYRIEAVLGVGGFGVTYKALDTHLNTWVAIKEYFPVEWSFRDADGVTVHPNTQGMGSIANARISDYQWGMERFLEEARVLAQIQHPYVVRVKRYFRANGTAYIVMDYEEGQPLSAILTDGETLTEEEVRGLLEDVVPALRAVHEHGYLHRDIKPANLYVRTRDQRVILIDFGAARFTVGRQSQSITSMVTPGYSPPEQYTTRNDRYGIWTDIYALGAVLYRCVTGQTPTDAADRLLDDHMEPAVEAGAGRYSTNLLNVIDRALAVRPEHRYRDMAEMEAALDSLSAIDTDETVVLGPLAQGNKAVTEAVRAAARRSPVAGPDNEEGDACEILPPVDVASAQRRALMPAGTLSGSSIGRRWTPAWLGIGAGLAVALAGLVWLWPAAPTPSSSLSPPAPSTPTAVQPTAVQPAVTLPTTASATSSSLPVAAPVQSPTSGLPAATPTLGPGVTEQTVAETAIQSSSGTALSPPASSHTPGGAAPPAATAASVPSASPELFQEDPADTNPTDVNPVPAAAAAAAAGGAAAAAASTLMPSAAPTAVKNTVRSSVSAAASEDSAAPVRPSATKATSKRVEIQPPKAQTKTTKPAARKATAQKRGKKSRRREEALPEVAPAAAPVRSTPVRSSNPWDAPAASGFNNK